jgi:hypothetical protein
MKKPVSREQLGRGWMAVFIKDLRKKIDKLKVKDSGSLRRSFEGHVRATAGGDLQKMQLLYEYYGAFVDMGVGRGTTLGGVKENSLGRRLEGKKRGNARRPKRWYSKTAYANVNRLADLFMENYGQSAQFGLVENMPSKIIIKT